MDFFKKKDGSKAGQPTGDVVNAATQEVEPTTLLGQQLGQLKDIDSQIADIEQDEDFVTKTENLKTLKKSKKLMQEQLNELVLGNTHLMQGKSKVVVDGYSLREKTSIVPTVSEAPDYKAIMEEFPTALSVKASTTGIKQLQKAVPQAMTALNRYGLGLETVKSIEVKPV